MIKAIFWDNDGVLVDTERLYFQASKEAMAKVQVTLTKADYIAISLGQGSSIFDLLGSNNEQAEQIDMLRNWRNDRFVELIHENGANILMPSVADLIPALSEQYQQAIVTSCLKEHFAATHSHTNLLQYFSFIVANGDYARSKPYPDPYIEAARQSELPIAECIAIEDTERGVKSAKAAGLACIAVPSELSMGGDFSSADIILDHLADLPKILANFP